MLNNDSNNNTPNNNKTRTFTVKTCLNERFKIIIEEFTALFTTELLLILQKSIKKPTYMR